MKDEPTMEDYTAPAEPQLTEVLAGALRLRATAPPEYAALLDQMVLLLRVQAAHLMILNVLLEVAKAGAAFYVEGGDSFEMLKDEPEQYTPEWTTWMVALFKRLEKHSEKPVVPAVEHVELPPIPEELRLTGLLLPETCIGIGMGNVRSIARLNIEK